MYTKLDLNNDKILSYWLNDYNFDHYWYNHNYSIFYRFIYKKIHSFYWHYNLWKSIHYAYIFFHLIIFIMTFITSYFCFFSMKALHRWWFMHYSLISETLSNNVWSAYDQAIDNNTLGVIFLSLDYLMQHHDVLILITYKVSFFTSLVVRILYIICSTILHFMYRFNEINRYRQFIKDIYYMVWSINRIKFDQLSDHQKKWLNKKADCEQATIKKESIVWKKSEMSNYLQLINILKRVYLYSELWGNLESSQRTYLFSMLSLSIIPSTFLYVQYYFFIPSLIHLMLYYVSNYGYLTYHIACVLCQFMSMSIFILIYIDSYNIETVALIYNVALIWICTVILINWSNKDDTYTHQTFIHNQLMSTKSVKEYSWLLWPDHYNKFINESLTWINHTIKEFIHVLNIELIVVFLCQCLIKFPMSQSLNYGLDLLYIVSLIAFQSIISKFFDISSDCNTKIWKKRVFQWEITDNNMFCYYDLIGDIIGDLQNQLLQITSFIIGTLVIFLTLSRASLSYYNNYKIINRYDHINTYYLGLFDTFNMDVFNFSIISNASLLIFILVVFEYVKHIFDMVYYLYYSYHHKFMSFLHHFIIFIEFSSLFLIMFIYVLYMICLTCTLWLMIFSTSYIEYNQWLIWMEDFKYAFQIMFEHYNEFNKPSYSMSHWYGYFMILMNIVMPMIGFFYYQLYRSLNIVANYIILWIWIRHRLRVKPQQLEYQLLSSYIRSNNNIKWYFISVVDALNRISSNNHTIEDMIYNDPSIVNYIKSIIFTFIHAMLYVIINVVVFGLLFNVVIHLDTYLFAKVFQITASIDLGQTFVNWLCTNYTLFVSLFWTVLISDAWVRLNNMRNNNTSAIHDNINGLTELMITQLFDQNYKNKQTYDQFIELRYNLFFKIIVRHNVNTHNVKSLIYHELHQQLVHYLTIKMMYIDIDNILIDIRANENAGLSKYYKGLHNIYFTIITLLYFQCINTFIYNLVTCWLSFFLSMIMFYTYSINSNNIIHFIMLFILIFFICDVAILLSWFLVIIRQYFIKKYFLYQIQKQYIFKSYILYQMDLLYLMNRLGVRSSISLLYIMLDYIVWLFINIHNNIAVLFIVALGWLGYIFDNYKKIITIYFRYVELIKYYTDTKICHQKDVLYNVISKEINRWIESLKRHKELAIKLDMIGDILKDVLVINLSV